MNNDRYSKQYKLFPFLAMLFITLTILLRIFLNKQFLSETINAAYIISPFVIILCDVIVEVYGYKIFWKLYWALVTVRLIFGITCIDLINLLLLGRHIEIFSYSVIFQDYWRNCLINPFAFLISFWVNARLLIKWKILLKGRHFWLRSVMASGIGEVLFWIIPFLLPPYPIAWGHAVQYIFWMIIFRTFFIAIFAYPASIIVDFLKIIERINGFSSQHDFNPFIKTSTQVKK